jgi:hypothetical protein
VQTKAVVLEEPRQLEPHASVTLSHLSLDPEARLLMLDSPEAIEQLETEYGPVRNAPGYHPDWDRLRADGIQGLMVPAYRKGFTESMWWRTIDADSACIFDVGVIQALELVPWTDAERQQNRLPKV